MWFLTASSIFSLFFSLSFLYFHLSGRSSPADILQTHVCGRERRCRNENGHICDVGAQLTSR